jgi:hypothetical protein
MTPAIAPEIILLFLRLLGDCVEEGSDDTCKNSDLVLVACEANAKTA